VKCPHDKWGFWLTCGWKDDAVRQRIKGQDRLHACCPLFFLSSSSCRHPPGYQIHYVLHVHTAFLPLECGPFPQGHSIISDHHVPQTCVVHPLFTCPDCGQGQLPVSDLVLICCLLTSRNSVLLAKTGTTLKLRNPTVRTELVTSLIVFACSLTPLGLESPPPRFFVYEQTRRWMDT
jgi:hypothetical protein